MRKPTLILLVLLSVALLASNGWGSSLAGASISLDLTAADAVAVHAELSIEAGAGPAAALELYLHRDVRIGSAAIDGKSAKLSSEAVPETDLRKWILGGVRLAPNTRSTVAYDASLPFTTGFGVSLEAAGGFLLPGSGWFPQLSPEADERVVHTTSFRLPPSATGIAAGQSSSPDAPWEASSPVRPFAVWGSYEQSEVPEPEGGGISLVAYRRKGGDVSRRELIAELLRVLEAGTGVASGEGPWKLVDVGKGVLAGGSRTLFWDEEASRAAASGTIATLFERDLAGALAASFWTEWVTCRGELGAWLSRGFAHYLGDVAYAALDASDDRSALESVILGARRAAFLEGLEGDRSLKGLSPASASASRVLETRGALLAHLAGDVVQTRSRWIAFLKDLRSKLQDVNVDWSFFYEATGKKFPNQHHYLKYLVETTDLPDFRITAHGPSEKRKGRYRVEVKNDGLVEAPAEVVTYTANGNVLYEYRLVLGPGQSRAVLFQDAERIGRIEVDPRGMTPQRAIEGETVILEGPQEGPREAFIPAFDFSVGLSGMKSVRGFHLELNGVSISEFDGDIQWYATHHGPSGACLLGKGTVSVKPGGPFAPEFQAAMGRESLTFRGSGEMWIRFPVSKWTTIEPQLGSPSELPVAERNGRSRYIYQHSFPTYFFDGNRAQLPPPASALVIFNAAGGERRGFVRQPLPDGRVRVRFWDHISGATLWEEIR